MEVSGKLLWSGIGLILLVGLIHLVDAPDSLSESSAKGLLFIGNFVGALLAAFGIWRRSALGWGLGILVAAGALIGYVLSCTVGIFGLPPDDWFEPLGVLSIVAEVLFVVLAAKVLSGDRSGLVAPARRSG